MGLSLSESVYPLTLCFPLTFTFERNWDLASLAFALSAFFLFVCVLSGHSGLNRRERKRPKEIERDDVMCLSA